MDLLSLVCIYREQGWATCDPHPACSLCAILVWPASPLEEKKIIWMNIVCTFAQVVGTTHDKNHHSFSARGGEKVAHH